MSFEDADAHALHRLIYYSRAEISSGDQLAPMMTSILSAAAPRNAQRGVSGALLACDEWFVQALEGERLTIGELYNLIRADRRHRNPTVIKAGPIGRRTFEGWGMCGRTLSPRDDAIVQTLATRKAFHPAELSAASALKLLEVVRNLQAKGPPRPAAYL